MIISEVIQFQQYDGEQLVNVSVDKRKIPDDFVNQTLQSLFSVASLERYAQPRSKILSV